MTTKEKLEKALEALRFIAAGKCEIVGSDVMYATTVHAHLTAPRTKEVEVRRYMIANPSGGVFSDVFMGAEGAKEKAVKIGCPDTPIIELTGTYTNPVHEPETWEGEVLDVGRDGFVVRVRCNNAPESGLSGGKRVIVEVCE